MPIGLQVIQRLAGDVVKDWKRVHYAALPYLHAMLTADMGCDDPRGVVLYFLSNAKDWRGDEARRIKAALREAIQS